MEAPLFKTSSSDEKSNIGTICTANFALQEKLHKAAHITEDDKLCLREIHRLAQHALKSLPRSPKTALSHELRQLRHISNRGILELGTPRLIRNPDAESMLNFNAANDKTHLLKNIEDIVKHALVPYFSDNSMGATHFESIEHISHTEIYPSPQFAPTIVQGKNKNRHITIIPYRYNQVGGRQKEDYVNASLLSLGGMSFIAAQGPIKNKKNDTIPDFLNMLKVGSNTIITLCMPEENGKEKCAPWWSPEILKEYKNGRRPEIWGSQFSIEPRSTKNLETPRTDSNQAIVKRRFNLVHNNHTRVVTQYHLENWPDGGVPDLRVLEVLIQKVMRHPIEGPLIVHCSKGVGRTGTFILAYKNYQFVQQKLREGVPPEEIKVNYFFDTLALRTQRMKMVGTVDQYEAVKQLIKGLKPEKNNP